MGCDAGQLRVAVTEGDAMPQYSWCDHVAQIIHDFREMRGNDEWLGSVHSQMLTVHNCCLCSGVSLVESTHKQFNIPFLTEVRYVFEWSRFVAEGICTP